MIVLEFFEHEPEAPADYEDASLALGGSKGGYAMDSIRNCPLEAYR